jgi:hypothetical protein
VLPNISGYYDTNVTNARRSSRRRSRSSRHKLIGTDCHKLRYRWSFPWSKYAFKFLILESQLILTGGNTDIEPQRPQTPTNPESIVGVLGDHCLSSAIKCNYYPSTLQGVQLSNLKLPAHLSSSLWLGAEQVAGDNVGWVNRTFWEMRSRGRWLAQQGLDAAAIMGDTCPVIAPFSSSTPCPSGEVDAKFWTVSRWAARFVDNFLQVSHADRLACWIVIFVTFQVRKSLHTSHQIEEY